MTIDAQTKKLAAIAYGEASVGNISNEIGGIAFAVANRARAWSNKTVDELLTADSNYTYAVTDGNARYKKLADATEAEIAADTKGMAVALDWAKKALANEGTDPSNGAFWWDGVDFGTNSKHPKRVASFKYGDSAHNIFTVAEVTVTHTVYWQTKRNGILVNTKVRGTYDHVYISTAAHGKTIFWKYNTAYVTATGAKSYK